MATLYFRYGQGKTADLCQVAYNYYEKGKKTIRINADGNREIVSKVRCDGKNILRQNVNLEIDKTTNLYMALYQQKEVHCVLVDNAHLITEEQALELFYIAKILQIPVICYADRCNTLGHSTEGSMRLMELANKIEPVDGHDLGSFKAKLHFFYGAMNCSKTAKLLYKADFLEHQGLNVCVVKPTVDRDLNCVKSRIGLERKADLVIDETQRLYGEGWYLFHDHINHILVDEAQFLNEQQIDDLYRITRDYHIPISCYGLKADFLTHHFPGSGRLLEIADDITKMKTVCDCGKGAEFNSRKNKAGIWQTEGSQVELDDGSQYIYVSLCEECYLKNVWGIDPDDPKVLVKKYENR